MKNYRKALRWYNCGKVGHRKRECTALMETSNIAMATKYNGTGATDIYPAMVDSGCSVHLVKDMKLLDVRTIQEATGSLCLADGNTIQISAVGTRTMQVDTYSMALRSTYYAEGLLQNLFSVRSAIQEGAEVSFSETDPHIANEGAKIRLIQTKGAWYLPPKASNGKAMLATASWSTWHERMGHPGNKKLSTLASTNEIRITGRKEPPENCTNCLLSKPRRTPVRSTAIRSGNNVVQVDVMSWSSKGWKGEQYVAVFSHIRSKLDVVFIYSRKDEATKALKEYFAIVRPKLTDPPHTIQTDAGTEFL
ncbi:MAG: hypothetical protein GY696_14145, partial [Gammaproteobacteria bacterium]|nr:hypothetical protein [Gammaproteobacteria bacterium]